MIGGVQIEPLSPRAEASTANDTDLNEHSLVFRLVYGTFGMLFTGDIGAETEELLARSPERVRCTILKVPHHGSRYSSSDPFLSAAAPRIGLISAGFKNSFHLPAQETLDRLSSHGIEIYRTDLDGTIQVSCEGEAENVILERLTGHFY
jgi:competence protein ComEC